VSAKKIKHTILYIHIYIYMCFRYIYIYACVCVRYDIKGCEVNRWTEPPPEGSRIVVVLKDLNFEGQDIVLGED